MSALPYDPAPLPHNLDAEQGVLGVILSDPEAFFRIEGVLRPESFYEAFHGDLYGLVTDQIKRGRTPSLATIRPRLERQPAFHDLGGPGYLGDLIDKAPPSIGISDLARAVADAAIRRDIIRQAADMAAKARDLGSDRDGLEQLADAERALADLSVNGPAKDEWRTAGAVITTALTEARTRAGRIDFSSGLASVDEVLGGFNAGEVAIIAGRPGMAKSTVGACIAKANARAGNGTVFFSMEMGAVPLGLRLACDLAYDMGAVRYSLDPSSGNPTFDAARKGRLSPQQAAGLEEAQAQAQDWPLLFDTRPGLTVAAMEAAVRRAHRRWARQGIAPGPVIVDHVGIIRPDKDRKGSRHAEVADVSRDLAVMAKRLDVPVVALCQLNRGVEGRDDKRPGLSDLRQAGELEEDARQVVMLYRPEYYLRPPEDADAESYEEKVERETKLQRVRGKLFWIIAKNSNGPAGVQVETFCDVACSAVRDMRRAG